MIPPNEAMGSVLKGAIDLHLHTSPSIFPRYANDLEVARSASAWGVTAFVLKAHEGSTAERAFLVNYAQPGSTAIGSIVLNHFVGGLNPFAVEVALALGARVVWLPSIHAANHLHHYGGATYSAMASSLTSRPIEGISLLDASGDIRPEVIHILGLVRDAGAILATGHINPNETRKVVAAAVELHLERVIVTHPVFEV
jgi:hypothetical protein